MVAAVPNTAAALSHALTIKKNGKTIGAVNEWQPRQQQQLTDLYEFGNVTRVVSRGAPFEVAPGNISGQQITARRYDLYSDQFEDVFGTTALAGMDMLGDQVDPLTLREVWTAPAGVQGWSWAYFGCWFESVGRNLSTTGDRTVNVDATIRYTYKKRIRGTGA